MGRLSPEVLENAVVHLQYEIDMFDSTARHLAVPMPDSFEKNVLLESFTIHFRALVDFLYPKGKTRPDDLLAWHYVGDENRWNSRRGQIHPALSAVRVNKEIAHLTLKRQVDPAAKQWDIWTLHRELMNSLKVFAEQAPSASIRLPNAPLPDRPAGLLFLAPGTTWTASSAPPTRINSVTAPPRKS